MTHVQLVVDLLDENTGLWNTDLVRKMFLPSDAEAILNLPRPRVQTEDYWAWGWERSGSFSVRSAYRELKERQCNLQATAGSSSGGRESWSALWKLRVQPKIDTRVLVESYERVLAGQCRTAPPARE